MSEKSLYSFIIKDINGNDYSLARLKGKYALLVNVASECGFTPQYKDLQKLSEEYGEKITVIGFPANNFGAQEPGSNDEIKSFCSTKYRVTFPMMSKSSVLGEDTSELYSYLAEATGSMPDWNFCKYLIDTEGNPVAFFPSKVNPLDDVIINRLT